MHIFVNTKRYSLLKRIIPALLIGRITSATDPTLIKSCFNSDNIKFIP